MSHETKYALVTGCTPGGIGHYLAIEFANQGFSVLATVRDPTKYTPPHPSITFLPLELTSQPSIDALAQKVKEITNGRLHVLYNNAGSNYTVPALDFKTPEIEAMFDANVFSVMKMCKAFTPLLIQGKGMIVQTGSLAGEMPYAMGACYCASKAALHAYSNTLRVELAPLGVQVITIVTGGVKSNIARIKRELPADSYMMPLKDVYESRLTHSQQVGMDTAVYAKRVVKRVLSAKEGWFEWGLGRTRYIWEGNMAWVVWFAKNYLPAWVLDLYFTKKFKLGRLRGTVPVGGVKKD